MLPNPHKIDIQQGNRIKQKDLDKIKIGMTRKQVTFVLGTPLLRDSFHQNRWDYIFHMKPGKGEIQQSRVSLLFKDDTLISIDDSHYRPNEKKATESSNHMGSGGMGSQQGHGH